MVVRDVSLSDKKKALAWPLLGSVKDSCGLSQAIVVFWFTTKENEKNKKKIYTNQLHHRSINTMLIRMGKTEKKFKVLFLIEIFNDIRLYFT